MPYIGTSPTQGVRVRYIYTATSSQTAFSGADANGVTLRYQDEEYVDVYKNGLILKTGTDYSLSSNTTMTLASGASNGDKIAIIVYDVFNVTVDDAYTKSTSDSRFLNVAGDTMSGALDLNGVELVLDADADTSITADTDDQIDIKIAGADDFQFTANTFTAQSGSSIVVPDGGLTFGSTAITTTGAELNLIDGGTARGTTAVASGDGILINDAGTMRMTNVDTVSTYFAGHSVGGSNIVTTGALNSGSITSGFGTIDTGSSTITTTGAISGGSLTANGGVTVDNITIDGTEIDLSSGDLTLDVAGDIVLDANGQQIFFKKDGTTFGQIQTEATPANFTFESTVSDGDIIFKGSDGGSGIEAMRIDMSEGGHLLIGTTSVIGTGNNTNEHIELRNNGTLVISKNAGVGMAISRGTNDGTLVQLQQAGTVEGTIDVSGTTVTYNGFAGSHESSGIPTNTPIGTVVSTIDELDVYFSKQEGVSGEENNPKAGQTRADHAKVKVSDTAGDKAVYGVVGNFNAQGKVNVASVGIGSVRVTGACAKGDLLESNGDGTATVQSDDIVRSKTIGKVTIGNSSTDVKLVSCVLYCG